MLGARQKLGVQALPRSRAWKHRVGEARLLKLRAAAVFVRASVKAAL